MSFIRWFMLPLYMFLVLFGLIMIAARMPWYGAVWLCVAVLLLVLYFVYVSRVLPRKYSEIFMVTGILILWPVSLITVLLHALIGHIIANMEARK